MLKKLKTLLIIIFLFIILFYTMLNPNLIIEDVLESLNLFINKLFPAMFIFYTLSDLLINYGFVTILELMFDQLFLKLFHISGTSSFIVIMSMFSGFPSGAKYTTNFLEKKLITKDLAHYLLTFTHFSNPLFIMGTVSLLFSRRIAFFVLLCHYFSNFILAFLIRPKKVTAEINPARIKKDSFSNTLASSFMKNSKVLLLILGNTIFFYTISDIVTHSINNHLIKTLIYGFFDLTKGIVSLNELNITMFFKMLLITSFLSFGGVSVHFQVKEIIVKEKLNYMYFLLGRISSLAISIILLIILFTIRVV